jgi:eukaryotic-like serine/threonine-protein kinase
MVILSQWLDRRGVERPDHLLRVACAHLFAVLALWCIWSFLLRGGLSYRLMGIHLRRSDGRKAARWQCALRVLLVWGPVVLVLCLALLVHIRFPEAVKPALAIWFGAVLLLPAYLWSALRSPGQAWHDRILGVYLVPN